MSNLLRFYLIVSSLFFLAYVLHMVRRDRFLLRYSFAWVVLGMLGVIAALFPNIVVEVSARMGFKTPSNFLFVACILFLMVVSLVFVSALSRQAKNIERLVQEVSLLRAEVLGSSEPDDEQQA